MNNNATIEKMQIMKLFGMERAFKTTMEKGVNVNFTPDEIIAHLVDAEYEERYNKKLNKLLTNANFRIKASFPEIKYGKERNIDKNMLLRFSDCDWIKKGDNLIITGKTGVGKSFIACALGNQACANGFKVSYFNCLKLYSRLKLSKSDGSYFKEIIRIEKDDLIILDDFGLEMMDNISRLILLEILDDRYGKKSTIITSQFPIKNWFDIIGDATIADAICDRIIHSAHKIEIDGDSMRKKQKRDS